MSRLQESHFADANYNLGPNTNLIKQVTLAPELGTESKGALSVRYNPRLLIFVLRQNSVLSGI